MANQTFTMLLHGEAGTGKSTLGNTAPAPRLILDAEGRAKYLDGPQVTWDPRHEAPPTADGSWETCVAMVPDYDTMTHVYTWLQSGQHGFVSVIVDSLMEVQKRLIDATVGMGQLDQRDWGTILRNLEKLVRDYRDLVLLPSNPTQCVVFTVGSRPGQDGRERPLLQGQMKDTVPYFVDTVGYLYVATDPSTGQTTRNLLVQPTGGAVAKDGTNRLPGPVIPEPNLSQLFALLNGHDVPVQSAPETPTEVAQQ